MKNALKIAMTLLALVGLVVMMVSIAVQARERSRLKYELAFITGAQSISEVDVDMAAGVPFEKAWHDHLVRKTNCVNQLR